MPIDYTRRTATPSPPPAEPEVRAEVMPGKGGSVMIRPDIQQAIDAAPQQIRTEITGPAATTLELLNAHLPKDEMVTAITSASASQGGPINSLIAITSRRLIFIAPAPQAVGWRLSTLTRSQSYMGYFFIEGDAGEYSPGLVAGEWATTFEARVKQAAAVAVLAGN